jgi:hypothetical protein
VDEAGEDNFKTAIVDLGNLAKVFFNGKNCLVYS